MATYLDVLNTKFAGLFTTTEFRDNKRVVVAADRAPAVLYGLLKCLRDECGFDYLCDLAGIDYLTYPNATDRFAVVYALTNTRTCERVFVKAFANDPDPSLPSAVSLCRGAAGIERGVYDMYGVRFDGHPD